MISEYESRYRADERLRRRLWILLWAAAIASYAAFTWAMLGPAWSHEAPTGWSYPFSCCSGYDCRQVTSGPQGTIRETAKGYVVASTGELIPFGDKRIKDSPDGEWHWCSQGGRDTGGTICLFVPPPAY